LDCFSEKEINQRREERLNKRKTRSTKSSSVNPLDFLELIVLDLMNYEESWPFLYPVDPEALGITDYFDRIKNPMDLSTVLEKIRQNKYNTIESFRDDTMLIFHNATSYNFAGTDVHNAAERLKEIFGKIYRLLEDIGNKKNMLLKQELTGKVNDHYGILEKLQNESDTLNKQLKEIEDEEKKI